MEKNNFIAENKVANVVMGTNLTELKRAKKPQSLENTGG